MYYVVYRESVEYVKKCHEDQTLGISKEVT